MATSCSARSNARIDEASGGYDGASQGGTVTNFGVMPTPDSMVGAMPEANRSFLQDLRATSRRWAVAFGACFVTIQWLAAAWHPEPLIHATTWLVVGLVIVPMSFVLGLAAVGAVLTVLLAMLASPFWLFGRPTGLRDLLRDLWGVAGHVLPGYWRALRRVGRPMLWGSLGGMFSGIVCHGLLHGVAP